MDSLGTIFSNYSLTAQSIQNVDEAFKIERTIQIVLTSYLSFKAGVVLCLSPIYFPPTQAHFKCLNPIEGQTRLQAQEGPRLFWVFFVCFCFLM